MNGVNLMNGNSHETHLYRTEIVIFLQKGKRSSPIQVMSGPGRPVTKVCSSNVVSRPRDGIDIDCVNEKLQKGLNLIEKDGRYFLDVVNKESSRLENFCKNAEEEMTENNIPEEVCGRIRATIGKAKLLTTKKFKQFRGLCEMNLGISTANGRRPTDTDLEGFWDMVMIQVEDVHAMFKKIDELRKNGWIDKSSLDEEDGQKRRHSFGKRSSLTRTGSVGRAPLTRQKSKEEIKAHDDQVRAAARHRLAAAKRKFRKKMRNSKNLDDVEIFCSPHK